jgi:hypothetical protein
VKYFLGLILSAVALQGLFPAKTPETFRKRYGKPLSETFLVRPGVVVSVAYGASGDTCDVLIVPRGSSDIFLRRGSDTINYKLLEEIENELAPENIRGKYIIGTFLDITCEPDNDCAGTQRDWKNLVMVSNAGENGARAEEIRWNRDECGPMIGIHSH